MKRIPSPLKWHGGKSYLADRIVALMPPHTHYIEPFAGGLSVLLTKNPEGVSEVVNDLNGELTNFWRVLQKPEDFAAFGRRLDAMPFSQAEWAEAKSPGGSRIDDAVSFFVRCRQSLAGRMDTFAPLSKSRTRRGMNEQASAWLSAVEGLPGVHVRLKRVVVLCDSATAVMRREDSERTLFYCDPPYLSAARASPDVYSHEMTEADHVEFLQTAKTMSGCVMISGYDSELYSDMLAGWTKHTFDLPNNAAGGKAKRRMVECLWVNG